MNQSHFETLIETLEQIKRGNLRFRFTMLIEYDPDKKAPCGCISGVIQHFLATDGWSFIGSEAIEEYLEITPYDAHDLYTTHSDLTLSNIDDTIKTLQNYHDERNT